MRRFPILAAFAALMLVVAACGDESSEPLAPMQSAAARAPGGAVDATTLAAIEALVALGDDMNQRLAAAGAPYRAAVAEWMGEPPMETPGRIDFFRDVGNRQLDHHWVPADPRRGGETSISYIIDQVDAATTLSIGETTAAIERAMGTWDAVTCSTIPLVQVPSIPGLDLGLAQGTTPVPFPLADITHGGWVPEELLPAPILGITISFFFIDPDELPDIVFTDIDSNGKLDTALREIYYADREAWGIDTGYPIDVESVALHEAGHGLSQGHFGRAFGTFGNGKVHFSPLALMNAAYSGVQQTVGGTDLAGHCSIWGDWPGA